MFISLAMGVPSCPILLWIMQKIYRPSIVYKEQASRQMHKYTARGGLYIIYILLVRLPEANERFNYAFFSI
jgi:hypothetical protein